MNRDLSGIVVRELVQNVDFMLRLKENLASRTYRMPSAMMSYISTKYSISMGELTSMHDLMLDHAISALGLGAKPDRTQARKVVVCRKGTKNQKKKQTI